MFTTLPNELISSILAQCQSAPDLYRLLAASPCCYRVFADAPEPILHALLRRVVPAAVWGEFAAACRADKFTRTDGRGRPTAQKHDIADFLDGYFENGLGDILGDKASLVAALRLHATIRYFVGDYVRATANEITFLAEHGAHGGGGAGSTSSSVRRTSLYDSDSPYPEALRSKDTDAGVFTTPSPTETTRLYRGFLRLELQSRVFRHSYRVFAPSPGAIEQFRLFIRRLPPWAVEEMTCAHQYLLHGVWDALDESTNCTPADERQPQQPHPHPLRHFGIDLPFPLSGLQTSTWPLYMSSLLLRGADFLYDVLVTQKGHRAAGRQPNTCAAPGERSSRMRQMVPHYLVSALELARHSDEPTGIPPEASSSSGGEEEEEDADAPSWGFCTHVRRARLAGRYLPVLQFQGHTAVRATGYVFWDAAKMRSDVMGNAIAGADSMSLEEYHDRYDRQYRRLRA